MSALLIVSTRAIRQFVPLKSNLFSPEANQISSCQYGRDQAYMEEARYVVEVVGLSPDAQWGDVHQFFSNCGTIRNLEIFRASENTSSALVSFEEAYSVEIALCLSGSEIAGKEVIIFCCGTYHVDPSPGPLHFDEAESNSLLMHSDKFVASPGEAVTVVQEAVQIMISKGYVLSKDALSKAKAFDESRQLSSTAIAKMFELSKNIGLTDKVNSGLETVKSVDGKFHVSQTTMAVASYTGKTAITAATAVVNSSYFARGALWVAGALDRAAKATAKLGTRVEE